MSALHIQQIAPGRLRLNPRNARTHSERQIGQIAASIEAFGFNAPVLIDATNMIIAGHGRVAAAKQLGLRKVPVIRIEHLSLAQLRAFVIADNRLAEKAGWDEDLLAIELQELTMIDLDFEIEATGFETAEIDLMLGDGFGAAEDEGAEEDGEPPARDTLGPPVTQPGEVWALGPHRLICGDARDPGVDAALMQGERARMVFADPPYNVPIRGHVAGLGATQHREFAMAAGEMSSAAFTDFLATTLELAAAQTVEGGIHFVCMDWRHTEELGRAARQAGLTTMNICIWVKSNGGMGSLYRSRHEMVWVLKSGTAAHVNNVELGRHGRYRTNVWDYAGVNSFGRGRKQALAAHPTVKPVALVADAIRDVSKRCEIVLDPFGGSGTTLIAAERAGRRARLIEIDPAYCDVILRRWRRLTGEEPVSNTDAKTLAAREAAAAATAEPEGIKESRADHDGGRDDA